MVAAVWVFSFPTQTIMAAADNEATRFKTKDHFLEKDGQYHCKKCPKIYSAKGSINNLKDHVQKKHGVESVKKFFKPLNIKQAPLDFVIDWVINQCLPFSIVDTDDFRNMVQALGGSLDEVPQRKKLRAAIEKKWGEAKNKLKTELNNVKSKLALTTDVWTSLQQKSYAVVTIHFMGPTGAIHHTLLDFFEMPHPHTGTDLNNVVQLVISNYNLENRIVSITTDNASNNVGAMDDMKAIAVTKDVVHIRCAPHVLNIVVQAGLGAINDIIKKVRDITKTFRTPKRLQLLGDWCKKMDVQYCAPTPDAPTRWGSTLKMISNLVKLRGPIDFLASKEKDFESALLSPETWDTLKELEQLLAPFHDATTALSGSKYVTSSMVVPIMCILDKDLQAASVLMNGALKGAADAMRNKLLDYLPLLKCDTAIACTVLDPRFNLAFFEECDEFDEEQVVLSKSGRGGAFRKFEPRLVFQPRASSPRLRDRWKITPRFSPHFLFPIDSIWEHFSRFLIDPLTSDG